MSKGKVIIFVALEMEALAIRRALAPLGPGNAEMHIIGIGGKRLPSDLKLTEGIAIVMAGLGGALDPALEVGDIIIDDREHRMPAPVGYRRGGILSIDHIVATPQEKGQLFKKTGALAVEMEGDVVRQLASRLHIPLISVRAISDTAAQVLDPEVVGFVDDVGRVQSLKLMAGLVRRPGLIPYLTHLRKDSRLAAERLGEAVCEIVDTLASG